MENVYTDGTVHCDNHVLKQWAVPQNM
jgi:hypothetical protein